MFSFNRSHFNNILVKKKHSRKSLSSYFTNSGKKTISFSTSFNKQVNVIVFFNLTNLANLNSIAKLEILKQTLLAGQNWNNLV